MPGALSMMILGNFFLFFILLVLLVVWAMKPKHQKRKPDENLRKIKEQIEK